MKTAFLVIAIITSIEFIDSNDDATKSYIKACFSDKTCSWLQVEKKSLTNPGYKSKMLDAMDQIIQTKENQ